MNPILGRWHSPSGDALCLILAFTAAGVVIVTEGGVLRNVPLADMRVERPTTDFPHGYGHFSMVDSGVEPLADSAIGDTYWARFTQR